MPDPAPTTPNPPPDRGRLTTEQRNPRSMDLDRLSVAECVRLINAEDSLVAGAVAAAAPAITAFIEGAEPRMRGGGRLIYIGAGTSGRLGVLDASECPPTFQTPPGLVVGLIAGGDASLRRSSEAKEDDPLGARAELEALALTDRDTLLGIAAGGTTPFVLGALEHAWRGGAAGGAAGGALTGLLTCAAIPTPRFVRHHIVVETGPEVVTGSTRMKAGTATKLVLNTISTTLMVRLGKVYENLMVDLRATNDKLRDRAARIVSTVTALDRTEALALLDRARGDCKRAIVMQRLGCTLEESERRLLAHEGQLRGALDGPKNR